LVCDEGRIRSATQLLWVIGTSKETLPRLPSAAISFRATAFPLTITSTGTFRESPILARSMFQYGRR
jgi:hypothetical protein